MILEIYKVLAELQAKTNGNPEISFSLFKNTFFLKVMWIDEGKIFKFKYQFTRTDLLQGETDHLLELLIQRVNREYAQKQLEERNE